MRTIEPLEDDWLSYIFNDGIFRLQRFNSELAEFNEKNGCSLTTDDLLISLRMWMSGSWFAEIKNEIDLEMYQCLRLVNSFICYNLQSIVSSIVRIRELRNPEFDISETIVNWPSLLQHGVNSQLKLKLIEMGLNDRIAVFAIADILERAGFSKENLSDLQNAISSARNELMLTLRDRIPLISLQKLNGFFGMLRTQTEN